MDRMPKLAGNLPDPATAGATKGEDRRVLAWPGAYRGGTLASPLLAAVTGYVDGQGGGEGLFPTAVTGFNIVRSFKSFMPMRQVYRPSICCVLQGGKEMSLGQELLTYSAMQYLLVSLELPSTGRIAQASPAEPYVGLTLDFDVAMMREVLQALPHPPEPGPNASRSVFVGEIDDHLAECILRLLRLCETPAALPVLYPSIMREVCYWLLMGPHGAEISRLALPETNVDLVVKAIANLHENFARPWRIEQLADIAGMSPSSFHHHFKALTALTPLQYQKQLRLLEARRLMVTEAVTVAEAAYKVGYESASQFSREYSRMFMVGPKQDVLNQRRMHEAYAGRTAG
jgi:AraC-like DNA-binding protein